MNPLSRRRTVKTLGAGVIGVVALAGCSGTRSSGDAEGGSGRASATASPSPTADSTRPASGATETATAAETASDGPPVDVDAWLSDVGSYDGVVDETDASSVTVVVGAAGNGGHFAFAPTAVRVAAGTTVTWRWSGAGGSHNVVADGGTFQSEMTTEEGYTFEHEFASVGVYPYYCMPHRALGMKGAVVVE